MYDERIDFIGLGAQKSATSWMFQCLMEHPEIRVGTHKEAHFFNFRYQNGYAWYQQQFEFGDWKTGEFSTLYLPDANVPARIHAYHPGVKLLVSLRNPVDRAYSQHIHNVRQGRLPPELFDFAKAVALNPSYLEQGLYATHLRRFLEYFPREQIHVMLYDDVKAAPDRVMEGLYRFLAVDDGFRPQSRGERINVARRYRNRFAARVFNGAEDTVKRVLSDSAVEQVKKLGIQEMYRRWNEVPVDSIQVPPLADAERARLTAWFAPEVEALQELLDRDLSAWLPR